MTAGLNLHIDVWRMNYASDDSVGGAVLTGTVAYYQMEAAITPRRPTQAALEQGLETEAIYDLTIAGQYRGANVTLHERDEVQVVQPVNHPLYGLRFRIVGVQPSRRRPRIGHQHATLSRMRRARSQQ